MKNPNVLYVSSYVPRKCGIATFTKDLIEGTQSSSPSLSQVLVMCNSGSENLSYSSEAKYFIRQENLSDYRKVAKKINSDQNIDLVCIQHEYGIYGGPDGEYVLELVKNLNKPIVTTFHTVSNPTPNRKRVLKELANYSSQVVVMLEKAAEKLASYYKIPEYKISVIPHGVPKFPSRSKAILKKKLKLTNKIVMSSINLISEWKGLVYAVESLPKIVKKHPNFIYQIIGETHPGFIKRMGNYDFYRDYLEARADELGVLKNIKFVNKYISLKELIEYVAATDIYITPYLYKDQTSSGALAYALGAGKVCISTPYTYAKESLKERGIILPFENSRAIAKAVLKVLENPAQRKLLEEKAYQFGKTTTWDQIGKKYLEVFDKVIIDIQSSYSTPELLAGQYEMAYQDLISYSEIKK